MGKILNYRKPTKQTADILCFAFMWRFYLISLPLFWLFDRFFQVEDPTIFVQSFHFVISVSFGFSLFFAVIFYLMRNGFKHHKIRVFYRDEMFAYRTKILIDDGVDVEKPRAINFDFLVALKLSWSFYWRSLLYGIIFLLIFTLLLIVVTVILSVIANSLNVNAIDLDQLSYGLGVSNKNSV